MIQEACKAKNQFQVCYQCSRGVTRLDAGLSMGHIYLSNSHPIPWQFMPVQSHRNDIPMDKPRVVHGTYIFGPFSSHSNLCLSHPIGRFPWDSHRNDITHLQAWLVGAWGKKQLWRPHVGTWGLLEANVLHWRKHLWYCWDFRRSPQWFGSRGLCPFPHSLRPCSAVRDSRVDLHDTKGARGYMASGARTKFGAPIFESEVLWKHIYCIEWSICDIVGNFWRPPQSFGAP